MGNFNPFSGPDASFGPEMVAGCEPAVTLINNDGGVLGHKMTCVTTDSRGDPADAVPAAQQLIVTHSKLVGTLGPSSDEALSVVPIFNQAKIPMFADTGQAFFNRNTAYRYFWRLIPADNVKGYALALWAHDHGYTRAAAVFGDDVGAQSDVPTLVQSFKNLGGKIVSNQRLALDQTSYRSEVEQMVAAKPQVIFTETDDQTAGTYFSELQQLHGLIPIVGTEVTLEAGWLKSVTGAVGTSTLERSFTGMQPYSATDGPAWLVYNKALLASGHAVPDAAQYSSDPYTMSYYDSVNIMALAMDAAKSTDSSVSNGFIKAVTAAGPGKVVVHSFAAGKAALAAGKQIQYSGASGEIAFNRWHNSTGAFEAAQLSGAGLNVKVVGQVSAAQIKALSEATG